MLLIFFLTILIAFQDVFVFTIIRHYLRDMDDDTGLENNYGLNIMELLDYEMRELENIHNSSDEDNGNISD